MMAGANERSEKIWALSRYLFEESQYEALLNQKAEYEKCSSLKSVEYDRPAVQTGPGDPAAGFVKRIDQLDRLNRLIPVQRETADKALDELESVIQRIDGTRAQRIFRLKYVCGYDWAKISVHVGLSEPSLYRIHGQVLDKQIIFDKYGKILVK